MVAADCDKTPLEEAELWENVKTVDGVGQVFEVLCAALESLVNKTKDSSAEGGDKGNSHTHQTEEGEVSNSHTHQTEEGEVSNSHTHQTEEGEVSN